MPSENQAERQKSYRERQQAKGLRQVLVWVPADRTGEIQALAAELRKHARIVDDAESGGLFDHINQ